MIPAYPKIFHLGRPETADIFQGPFIIEEKLDGSQFSFGTDGDGRIHCRSKGALIDREAPPKMFREAVDYVQRVVDDRIGLHGPHYQFFCEYLQRPKHNSLTYNRVPKNNLALFAVRMGHEWVTDRGHLQDWGDELDLEVVPTLFQFKGETDDRGHILVAHLN